MRIAALLMILLVLPAVSAIYSPNAVHTGCVISNNDGTFQDVDCDKVPDIFDNCPLTQNPVQSDVDQNGIGDMCDLVIDEITIDPETPMQGRSVLIRTGVFNNRDYPMRNLIVKAEIPRLGQVIQEPIPTLNPGQRHVEELLLRIPPCAPTRLTDIVAYVEYPFAPGQKEVFSNAVRIPIAPSGLCGDDPNSELTVVDIIELQDVLLDRPAVYPFTITNNWPESKAYILTVQGVHPWGTATIDPGSVVVIPAGQSREGAIIIDARDADAGMQGFTFSVNAREDARQILLQADVKRLVAEPTGPAQQELLYGLLGFLAVLALIGIVALIIHRKDGDSLNEYLSSQFPKKTPKKSSKKGKKSGSKKSKK